MKIDVLPRASALALLMAGPCFAQTVATSEPADDSKKSLEEVVVTGTMLRGIAPAASQVISLGKDDALATGALSSSQLLSNIPQMAEFNSTPAIVGTNNIQVTVNRVNLRNLPGNNAGSSPTLVLLNGHRIVGAGIKQTQSEPDFLPPTVLERVEVVPDGGSSIYGADAVGGVINFITRRRFDGLQVEGHYGFADDYNQSDASLTAGHDWGSGSAYVAFSHAEHDALYGADRDYVKYIDWTTGLGAEPNCDGNVAITDTGGVTQRYVVSGSNLLPGRSFCDRSGQRTLYPEEDRNSVFANLYQEFSDTVTLDVHGYFTRRKDVSDEGPLSGAATINATTPFGTPNPFYRNVPGTTSNRPQTVQIIYPFGDHSFDRSDLKTWGVTPTLTVKLGADWQLRLMGNHGRSSTEVANPLINAVAQGTAAALGQLNPYNITSNTPAVLTSIGNWEIYGRSRQETNNGRAVFDGPLFSLPGGEVRAAVGIEYLKEDYEARVRSSGVVPGQEATIPLFSSSRNTKAAFAELSVPIVGADNEVPLVHSFTASLSARYDDYSDFGDTTNPTYGLNWEPVSWIDVRAHWGKSFQAPSLGDSNAADNGILVLPSRTIVNPFQAPAGSQTSEVIFSGGSPNIKPQEATIYSAGLEIRPPFVPDLSLTATYYNVEYSGIVDLPPVFNASVFFTQFTQNYIMNPTPAQTQAFIAGSPDPVAANASILAQGGYGAVYALLDSRRRNLGDAKVSGLDFGARYTHEIGFGQLFASFNGTYRLNIQTSANVGLPLGSNRAGFSSRLRYVATVGATVGDHLRAQATLNHSKGFNVTPTFTNNFQDEVGSFDTINLFTEYDFNAASGLGQDLGLTLSVNNVLDRDPPTYQGLFANLTYGYANGGTVGRLVQLGVNKKF